MNYQQSLEYIHSFAKFGSQLGLERMRSLLECLGNPQDSLQYIHVAGTNGKGSTTTMCANILSAAGYKTGLYTSPFVVDFRERFQIDGQMIPEETFAQIVTRLSPVVEQLALEGTQITEFELITAIALCYFKEENCNIVCLEVGLGGNYDATNVIACPLVSVITSISMDHTQILGDTVEKIAVEKAGIIKEQGTCVCYPKQDVEAMAVLMEKCALTQSVFVQPASNQVEIRRSDADGCVFLYREKLYQVRLAGEYQVYNAVTAIETMEQLKNKGFPVSDADVRKGLQRAVLPARFERLSSSPLIFVDGAHNKEGMEALAKTLREMEASSKVVIMGMLADKDYICSLQAVCSLADAVVTVPVNNPRALSPQELAGYARQSCAKVQCCDDYVLAVRTALEQLDESGMLLICGSLYLAGDMRKAVARVLSGQ